MLSKEFIEEMRARLLAEKEKIEQVLSELSEHTEMGDEREDNALEVEQDMLNADLIERNQEDLNKIDWALSQIEQGTYGTDKDGNQISEERLRVMPWADTAL